MKRRYRVALLAGGLLAAAVLAPILYIEGSCGGPGTTVTAASKRAMLDPSERRPEVRTWLTYPEWHIVYSAQSLGTHLAAGKPPSHYPYGGDIAAFWRATCAVNRVTDGLPGAGEAKVMIYTIGISYSAELVIKAAWERTIGRLSAWVGGHDSADDRYAARVQQNYAAFMHQTPWYQFPFGHALSGLWRTNEPRQFLRHWERRLALSLEYSVKAAYAKLIGWASGATLGRDQLTLRFVARTDPRRVVAVDSRLKPIRTAGQSTVVEAPRYAEFTGLLRKLAMQRIELTEIAGNDEIFLTALVRGEAPGNRQTLFAMGLGDHPGWQRIGMTVKVPDLANTIRAIETGGGRIEHVYDY